MTSLRTERLLLRRPTRDDMEPWMEFLVSPRGVWHGGGPEHGEGRAWRIIAILMGHWQIRGYGTLVAEDAATGRPLGCFGPFNPANWPERELGWSIWSPDDEGQGYAFEACRAMLRHLFEDLGWPTVVSYVAPDNARSIALAERLGAKRDAEAARPMPTDLVYRHRGIR